MNSTVIPSATIDMAKKKASSERSPKNKERTEPGFRTIGIRVSNEYADWLAMVAKHERVTIAAYLDRAAAAYAESVGISDKPPERIP